MLERLRMRLEALNTNGVALTGLTLGLTSIIVGVIAAVRTFFAVLSDKSELVALYVAAKTHTDPTGAVATLVGAFIAIVGAFTLLLVACLLLAFFGKPPSANTKGPP